MASVYAIIPARSGSKGVLGKNVRLLWGYPLLAWSVAAAKAATLVDRILVSTDSRQYANIAINYGAEAPFLRPAELAADHSLDIDFINHALNWLWKNEGSRPDYLVHLRPTCPIRQPEIIDEAIKRLMAHPQASSLCSVHPVEYPPCKYFKMDADGVLTGYMGEEHINLPRQSCLQGYQGNGHVDVLRTASILRTGNLHGPKRLGFLTPNPGDIDTEDDFIRISQSKSAQKAAIRLFNLTGPGPPKGDSISKKRYCFDVDGTICHNTQGRYEEAKPIPEMIAQINKLYQNGHTIIMFTARGSTTGLDWRALTERQLSEWGVFYHELILGKPEADFYIDDRGMSLAEWANSVNQIREN